VKPVSEPSGLTTGDELLHLKHQVIVICRQLYEKGLLAGADGNLSVKLGTNSILTTPTGAHKGFITKEELVITDLAGNVTEGTGRPSSELAMHVAIYEADPACRAIVHTHAPYALALSLSNRPFDSSRLAETELILGEVVEVPYAPPGTPELARAVAACTDRGPVQILARHGAVSRGKTLMEAFQLMECLEHNARILVMAELLGRFE